MPTINELLEKCNDFHSREHRHLAFPFASWICKEDLGTGISFLLSVWNVRWSGRKEFSDVLQTQVAQALKESEDILNKLDQHMLENDTWNKKRDEVVKIFEVFEQRPAIRITGASKALHLLKPDLFVMWDGDIREKKYKINTSQYRPNGKKYLEFLEKCREFAKDILNQITKEELLNEHYSRLNQTTKRCYQLFSYHESLPKMIDEFNYAVVRW